MHSEPTCGTRQLQYDATIGIDGESGATQEETVRQVIEAA